MFITVILQIESVSLLNLRYPTGFILDLFCRIGETKEVTPIFLVEECRLQAFDLNTSKSKSFLVISPNIIVGYVRTVEKPSSGIYP